MHTIHMLIHTHVRHTCTYVFIILANVRIIERVYLLIIIDNTSHIVYGIQTQTLFMIRFLFFYLIGPYFLFPISALLFTANLFLLFIIYLYLLYINYIIL